MFAPSIAMSSSDLMNNFMNALSESPVERRASAPSSFGSPETNLSALDEIDFPGVPALALPAAIEGDNITMDVPLLSNATVVSNAWSMSSSRSSPSPPAMIITKNKSGTSSTPKNNNKAVIQRRCSLPSNLVLSNAPDGDDAVTHPVPEFLCHLYSMLSDPSLSEMISWTVPTEDEPDHVGGGMKGIGKIVCLKPQALQEGVLGRYYRHSKYASFQRQLNYFGFKKRLHGGKKGKLSPCSYIHEKLGTDPQSLFQLKRRPPLKKRASMASVDSSMASVSSAEDASSVRVFKKQRSVPKEVVKSKKSSPKPSSKSVSKPKKVAAKKDPKQVQVALAAPIQFLAQEYVAPSMDRKPAHQPIIKIASVAPFAVSTTASYVRQVTSQSVNHAPENNFATIQHNNYAAAPYVPVAAPAVATTAASAPVAAVAPRPIHVSRNTENFTNSNATSSAATSVYQETSFQELLSTSLPPPDVLFNDDDIEGMNGSSRNDTINSNGFWVTDDGRCMSHNSLVDLAMFY